MRVISGRRLVLCAAPLLTTCCGCFYGDSPLYWEVRGQLVDAQDATPIGTATIRLRLTINGRTGHDRLAALTDDDGGFQVLKFARLSGFSGFLLFPFITTPQNRLLSPPPDQIDIEIETENGRRGVATVTVSDDSIVAPPNSASVGGIIDLGTVEVSLVDQASGAP